MSDHTSSGSALSAEVQTLLSRMLGAASDTDRLALASTSRTQLIDIVEVALVRPAEMHALLKCLATGKNLTTSARVPHYDDDTLDLAASSGLQCLSTAVIVDFLTDPIRLLVLRDRLLDDEPSDHWLAILAKTDVCYAALPPEKPVGSVVGSNDRPVAPFSLPRLVAFSASENAKSGVDVAAHNIHTWYDRIPLNGPNVKIFPENAPQKDSITEIQNRTLRIDFSLRQYNDGFTLTLRLGVPFIIAGDAEARVFVLDQDNRVLAEADRVNTSFVYEIDRPRIQDLRNIQISYHNPTTFQAIVTAPLHLPETI